jgi:hypothetical protein
MEFIATIESARLFYPMDGTMFTSVDPYHGVPDPFHPTMNWETMRCPHCRMRPFVADDVIKTSIGMMAVPIRGEATEVATPPLTATPKVTAKKKPTKVSTKVEESAPENAEDNPSHSSAKNAERRLRERTSCRDTRCSAKRPLL